MASYRASMAGRIFWIPPLRMYYAEGHDRKAFVRPQWAHENCRTANECYLIFYSANRAAAWSLSSSRLSGGS